GRPLRVRPQTLAWLHRYKLRWDLLIMRHWGDYAAARDFKEDTVADLRAAGFDLRLAFEDDRRNHEMFKAEGVPCVYIHSGYYEYVAWLPEPPRPPYRCRYDTLSVRAR